MLAFRYFGDSDGLYVTCSVFMCKIDDKTNPKCQRCGGSRKRRDVSVDNSVILEERFVTTRPIFILERGKEIHYFNNFTVSDPLY